MRGKRARPGGVLGALPRPLRAAIPVAIVLALVAVVTVQLVGRDAPSSTVQARPAAAPERDEPQRSEVRRTIESLPPQPPKPAPPAKPAPLPVSTTETDIPAAPQDSEPLAVTEGDVVQPFHEIRVHDAPDGKAFARMPTTQFGDTWLPVVDREAGWVKVLLPSRPNGSVGWLREDAVSTARSPYLVRVHVGSRTLELVYDGDTVGTWPVAVGEPATPTPTGRTFVLGSVIDPGQSHSPVILPLGSHSDTLDTYGGGPGTVALHTWPDASVFGTAASHGCIRVPAPALDRLSQVPLGTLVVVDEN